MNIKLNIKSMIFISLMVAAVCGASIIALGSTVLFPDTQVTEDGLLRAGLLGGAIPGLFFFIMLGGLYLIDMSEKRQKNYMMKTPF